MDSDLSPSHKELRPRSPRPRSPSPPPHAARAREPPSPVLLAQSLPSTATLNALSRLGSYASFASIPLEQHRRKRQQGQDRASDQQYDDGDSSDNSSDYDDNTPTIIDESFNPMNSQGSGSEWILLCGEVMTKERIREALQLNDEPPLEQAYWMGKEFTIEKCEKGDLVIEDENIHSTERVINGLAYQVRDQDDKISIVNYLGRVFDREWNMVDCDIFGIKGTGTAIKGKIPVARRG